MKHCHDDVIRKGMTSGREGEKVVIDINDNMVSVCAQPDENLRTH